MPEVSSVLGNSDASRLAGEVHLRKDNKLTWKGRLGEGLVVWAGLFEQD